MSLRSLVAETIRPVRREIAARRRNSQTFPSGDKLNLGCGSHLRPGWLNVDLGSGGTGSIDWDLTKPIPLPAGTVSFIYSEHFIEHITRDEALRHFSDCRRLLAPDGVLRLSTPNLQHLAQCYLAGDISAWSELGWSPKTPAQFINEAMHLWGHQFVYDREELHLILRQAGFSVVSDQKWRQSSHIELRDLETRPYNQDLIVEAVNRMTGLGTPCRMIAARTIKPGDAILVEGLGQVVKSVRRKDGLDGEAPVFVATHKLGRTAMGIRIELSDGRWSIFHPAQMLSLIVGTLIEPEIKSPGSELPRM